ncbi:hypothetical protein [Xylella fastidiosa]|nr:hypothetical protein [Xylella fastidiosa]WNY21559.1 hypothetical protein RO838_01005 [Xylella fastidiosa]
MSQAAMTTLLWLHWDSAAGDVVDTKPSGKFQSAGSVCREWLCV